MQIVNLKPQINNRSPFKKLLIQLISGFIAIFLIMSILSAIFGSTPPKEIRLGELIQEINDDKVDYIKVYGNNLDIKLKNGEKQKSRKEAEGTLSETLNNSGVSAEKIASIIEVEGDSNLSIFLNTVLLTSRLNPASL